MHHYKHHIGDYRSDTGHLSLLEHGAYRQLLDLYYLDEKPIPKKTEWVFRRLRAVTEIEQEAIVAVLNDFFVLSEDGWHHTRCDRELADYASKSEASRQNGQLGGRPRKSPEAPKTGRSASSGKPKKTKQVSDGNQGETEVKANETLTTNQEPLTTNQEPAEEGGARSAHLSDAPAVCSPEMMDGVPLDLGRKFLGHRKRLKVKGPFTVDAWNRHVRESAAAGLSHADAMQYAIEANWQSFTAAYYLRAIGHTPSGGYKTKDQKTQEAIEAFLSGDPSDVDFLDGEYSRVLEVGHA